VDGVIDLYAFRLILKLNNRHLRLHITTSASLKLDIDEIASYRNGYLLIGVDEHAYGIDCGNRLATDPSLDSNGAYDFQATGAAGLSHYLNPKEENEKFSAVYFRCST
jgi:hypothetical protein